MTQWEPISGHEGQVCDAHTGCQMQQGTSATRRIIHVYYYSCERAFQMDAEAF